MPKKRIQTRRAISVDMETYYRVSAYAEEKGIPRSRFIESRINDFLDAVDRAEEEASEAANEYNSGVPVAAEGEE